MFEPIKKSVSLVIAYGEIATVGWEVDAFGNSHLSETRRRWCARFGLRRKIREHIHWAQVYLCCCFYVLYYINYEIMHMHICVSTKITSLQAFSLKADDIDKISLVWLNLIDVHGVVKFMKVFAGFGLRSCLSRHSSSLYKFTTPDLHLFLINMTNE